MFLRPKPQRILSLSLLPGLLLISILQPAIAQEKPKQENPHARWEATIAKFEQQDKANPPAKGGVLFVGSSSIRLWKLDESFPNVGAINRGFGGSEIADSTHFAKRIILKHEPRLIFLYAGDSLHASGHARLRHGAHPPAGSREQSAARSKWHGLPGHEDPGVRHGLEDRATQTSSGGP